MMKLGDQSCRLVTMLHNVCSELFTNNLAGKFGGNLFWRFANSQYLAEALLHTI